MAQSYKSLKEDFVSNLSGGSIWEINLVTAVAPSAVLLWSALQARRDFFIRYDYAALTTDFLLNVGAILAAVTIYSSTPLVLNIFLVLPALCLYLLPSTSRSRQKRPSHTNGHLEKDKAKTLLDPLPERPYITHYRGSMMVVTCVAILAVDFKVFPRRYAKVETWGTSLMDMGVGSFVFSAGLISARPILKARMNDSVSTVSASLKAAARHSLPLLALGLIRLYSVKGLDYAEHVSEYGVHWNFFFTLAALPLSGALLHLLPQRLSTIHLFALLMSGVYEAFLHFTPLKAYILTATRDGFLGQNREGIFSLSGYVSIFLMGQVIGLDILPRQKIASSITMAGTRVQLQTLTRLLFWAAWFSLLLFLATSYKVLGLHVSRRLANLPYVLWVSAFNCAQLALFCAVERMMFSGSGINTDKAAEARRSEYATSSVLGAYNKNGLAIFLLANLLTGAVNMTTDTLRTSSARAMATLFAYMGTLTLVATILQQRKMSIKL
ncbi:MAG: hypothetical protein Q9174_003129 [Haloplaca sp. 1 TL-2023]